ncbi:hypothetical protein, partial [Nostoc sp. 'Peltigera malacea cyanobiont' DB3992]|uniref:hypothetical protein n=1 Tax=Nostoc sp. 'Peltigera malacea cyanobiont' DB3992 TaxID=1206980 RepID=UPI00211F3062
MQATVSTELTQEKVDKAVNAILEVLGKPENDLHHKALTAFQSGDYQTVKRLASTNLTDDYCKALGYLGGALKLTPNTDTIWRNRLVVQLNLSKKKHCSNLVLRS